jgi:hypothetical protein
MHYTPLSTQLKLTNKLSKLLEIAEGLWYLHSEGVVHGDFHWVCFLRKFPHLC